MNNRINIKLVGVRAALCLFVLLRKYRWRLCLDQACIFAHTVESRFLVTQQIFGRIKLYFFALGQNQNFCVVKDGVEPVGNGQNSTINKNIKCFII